VSNLPFIFNISFVLLHIEMLLSGTMNVVAFLFIREEWRFYVGALFFSSRVELKVKVMIYLATYADYYVLAPKSRFFFNHT
jgi:hypothetical protein